MERVNGIANPSDSCIAHLLDHCLVLRILLVRPSGLHNAADL